MILSAVQIDAVRNRPLRDEEDVRRVRRFLVQTYPRTPLGFLWDVRRWDGQRYYQADPAFDPRWAAQVQLWETRAGELVGAVCLEGAAGETRTAHLQVDPAWRSLDAQMIEWAETFCISPPACVPSSTCISSSEKEPADRAGVDDSCSPVEIFVYAYDEARSALLAARGYAQTARTGVVRRMHFGGRDWPEPLLPPGYTLRTTHARDFADAQMIADLLNAAFNRDFHTAQEYFTFTQFAPSFRPDLDLVAVAPDGTLAAYVGVPYDSDNRRGIFEPVCTHPQHRRRGLAQALMVEGVRRLKALGAVDVTVETGAAPAANRLYDLLGFDETEHGAIWRKDNKAI